ncbi:DNA repair protein complementing XP-G cells-like isoform X2 [Gigantopelta aegis]|uniref:DNA repair protein complementing XP-G cells-like isoform X2 n=1 Tax=Gigantopelta aegis TaxID=1735272 RepID=UPI001B88C523|nr:DNA repair protein complementing XP-G cells-like isoform X2 [Gigantopelta aegis]
MGVQGLWQLLQSTGKPISLQSLEGKKLAVDVSIWLHQVTKGLRDKDGHPVPGAHLQGLFSRVCKLLYYRLKPVFVFDGGVPSLKKQTTARRRERNEAAKDEAHRTKEKLVHNLLHSHAVRSMLGTGGESASTAQSAPVKHDLFELPPLPEADQQASAGSKSEDEDLPEDVSHYHQMIEGEFQSLEDVDVESEDFQSLPSEIKHEILTEMKEVRKRRWTNAAELPQDAEDFSSYQMAKILKQSRLTTRLDAVRKELNVESCGDVSHHFGDASGQIQSQRVVSDDTSHYILIQGVGRHRQVEEDSKRQASTEEQGQTSSSESNKVDGSINTCKVATVLQDNIIKQLDDIYNCEELVATAGSGKTGGANDSSHEDECSTETDELCKESSEDENERFKLPANCVTLTKVTIVIDHERIPTKDTDDGGEASIITTVPTFRNCVTSITHKQGTQQKVCRQFGDKVLMTAIENTPALLNDETKSIISDPEMKSITRNCETKSDEEHLENHDKIIITSSDDSADENFIEVVVDPLQVKRDDMFPAAMFELDNKMASNSSGGDSDDNRDAGIKTVTESKSPSWKKSGSPHVDSVDNISKDIDSVDDISKDIDSVDDISKDIDSVDDISKDIDSVDDISKDIDSVDDISKDIDSVDDISKDIDSVDDISKDIDSVDDISKDIDSVDDISKDIDSVDDISKDIVKVDSAVDISKDIVKVDSAVDISKDIIKVDSADDISKNIIKLDSAVDINEGIVDVENKTDDFKANFTVDDLEDLQDELSVERQTLTSELGRQERLATSLTDQITSDAQELLQLFGIPYIVSPMEAEAQCAFLDSANLIDGTITDDSDIWLFGGRTVYKNFFNHNRHVELYTKTKIDSQLGTSREQLINVAYLCGSDYTVGIPGVGPVTALEILAEFPGVGISALCDFKTWWEQSQSSAKPTTNKLKSKLRHLNLEPGFPNPSVAEAYLKPAIDDSTETFTWGMPDLDLLRNERMGWSQQKTDSLVLPVLKQLNDKQKQLKISSYFQPENFVEVPKIVSLRVKRALNKINMSKDSKQVETNECRKKKAKQIISATIEKRKRKSRVRGKKTTSREDPEREEKSVQKVKDEVDLSEGSSSGGDSDAGTGQAVDENVSQTRRQVSESGGFFPHKDDSDPRTEKQLTKVGKGKGRGKNR